MNKNYSQSSEYTKNCENLNLIMSEMELAKIGIENLKFTYQTDPNIVSQLDIIILKINTVLKEIGQKLIYFQGFLTRPQTIYNDKLHNYETSTIGIQSESYQNTAFHDLTSIKIDGHFEESHEEDYINMEQIKD